MLLKRKGTFVGIPEGAFIRFIGAKKARYTCAMASTRNSFLRGAAPGNVGAAFEEAILSSIAKRLNAPVADKKGRVQRPRTAKRITGGHPQSKAKRQSPAFSPDPWIADAHTIPSGFPTSASVSAAFNNCSRLCVALTIARSRALPSATIG